MKKGSSSGGSERVTNVLKNRFSSNHSNWPGCKQNNKEGEWVMGRARGPLATARKFPSVKANGRKEKGGETI